MQVLAIKMKIKSYKLCLRFFSFFNDAMARFKGARDTPYGFYFTRPQNGNDRNRKFDARNFLILSMYVPIEKWKAFHA